MSKKSKREAKAAAAETPDNVTFMGAYRAKKYYDSIPPAPPEPPLAKVTSFTQFKADKRKS